MGGAKKCPLERKDEDDLGEEARKAINEIEMMWKRRRGEDAVVERNLCKKR